MAAALGQLVVQIPVVLVARVVEEMEDLALQVLQDQQIRAAAVVAAITVWALVTEAAVPAVTVVPFLVNCRAEQLHQNHR